MNIIAHLFNSSLGKKYIMAITGCVLFLFVVAHLLGNLQIFLGPESINAYGHFLQSNVEILWPARVGLLFMIALHIGSAISLAAENRLAQPISYANNPIPVATSYASRTMLMSGLIIAAFAVYHLLHYTAQVKAINLTGQDFIALRDAKGRHDVFKMMVTGFSHPLISGFYILAMAMLSLHLSHGASAMFQSVGLKNRAYGPLIDRFAQVSAWIIFLGYSSIPVAVLLGFGKEALK